jgi:hypothetical protein
MKAVKICFGVLAGLFALAHCIYLSMLIIRGAYISEVLGSFAGLLIGAAISITLFKSAFKKKAADKSINTDGG